MAIMNKAIGCTEESNGQSSHQIYYLENVIIDGMMEYGDRSNFT